MFWTEMTLKRAKRHVCGGEGGRIHWGRWGIGLVSCSMRPRSACAVEEEARPTQPNTSRAPKNTKEVDMVSAIPVLFRIQRAPFAGLHPIMPYQTRTTDLRSLVPPMQA